MINNILDTVKKLHFVGIGGSGMCPMAEILKGHGYQITGSDISESETVQKLRQSGIKVLIGHNEENIGDCELVVYTAAAKDDNPELVAAKNKGIPTLERSVVLGMLTKKFENTIAISGTHGKTSTTGMISQILITALKDPSAIIGGKLPLINSNSRIGKSEHMVCEACEYVDTFLQIHPSISVITNIDADHLDYFKTLDNIIKSFRQFALQTTNSIVYNGDNENTVKAVAGLTNASLISFGISDKNDYYPTRLNALDTACETFTLSCKGEELCEINLQVPGEHNMENALAAAAATHSMGVEPKYIKEALEGFVGVHRRFEILGKFNGVTVADDFAHHPTELSAILNSASKMGYNEVWAIFQPHTYSRTHNHLDEFAQALSIPEHVIMTEILAVREENVYGVSTQDLEDKIEGSCHFSTFDEIADYVMSKAQENDLILTMGGGDIYKCANLIVEKYENS